MKRPWLIALALWVGLAGGSFWLRQRHRELAPPRPALRWQDVMLDLLGEGRTMLARLLYFKMDAVHEQLDESGVGVFQQSQVIPLLRMATYLDPTLVDAYDVIAFDLFKGHNRLEDAIRITDEGLLYNPSNYVLNWRRSFFALKQKDWPKVLQHANLAYVNAGDDVYRRIAALRLIYRVALAWDDYNLGITAVEAMRMWLPSMNDPDHEHHYQIWLKRRAAAGAAPPAQVPSGPAPPAH